MSAATTERVVCPDCRGAMCMQCAHRGFVLVSRDEDGELLRGVMLRLKDRLASACLEVQRRSGAPYMQRALERLRDELLDIVERWETTSTEDKDDFHWLALAALEEFGRYRDRERRRDQRAQGVTP